MVKFETNLGRQSSSVVVTPEKIIFDLPTTIDSSFANSLKTILIEKTTESWDFSLGLLQAFVDKEGHARPEKKYKTSNGYSLGAWVNDQRVAKEDLLYERKIKLESLAGWVWSKKDFQWEQGFNNLEAFVEKEGHSRPFQDYKTADGYALGAWVGKQRSRKDQLSSERKAKLESLEGWAWDTNEFLWELGFSNLLAYIKREGHAMPLSNYKTEEGYELGMWIGIQRNSKEHLTSERKARLESIDCWVWDSLDFRWEQGFNNLEAFVEKEGHSRPFQDYKTADGYALGGWVVKQRSRKDQLSSERKAKLESLEGWVWDITQTDWDKGFQYLKAFTIQEGHASPIRKYKSADGFNLGFWVERQRIAKDTISHEYKVMLESLIGWDWDPLKTLWELGFTNLKVFAELEGHARPAALYKTSDGFKLGSWVNTQRTNKEKLSIERKDRLEALDGWVWDVREFQWNEGFKYLQEFVVQEGHSSPKSNYIAKDGYKLGNWVNLQSRSLAKLSHDRKVKLESIPGWTWSIKKPN